ncbi:MAG: SRPBCC domain-containing protein [Myxococcota bacterium]
MRRAHDERILPHPPAAVWAALIDLPAWDRWNMVTATAPAGLVAGEDLHLRIPLPGGRRLPARARLVAVETERALRWRGGPRGVFVGEHGYRLSPAEGGTRLVHEEVFSGVAAGLVTRLLGLDDRAYGRVSAALDRYLRER